MEAGERRSHRTEEGGGGRGGYVGGEFWLAMMSSRLTRGMMARGGMKISHSATPPVFGKRRKKALHGRPLTTGVMQQGNPAGASAYLTAFGGSQADEAGFDFDFWGLARGRESGCNQLTLGLAWGVVSVPRANGRVCEPFWKPSE